MNKHGETPLEEAIMCESVPMVEALLANGADVASVHNMAMNTAGAQMVVKCPEIFALIGAETQRRVFVEEERRALEEAIEKEHRALEEAIMCESVPMVEALLANGVDVASVHNMAMNTAGAQMVVKCPEIFALIGAETQRRVFVKVERVSLAFAMGNHKRLGTESRVKSLLPELVKMVIDLYVNQ
jgi:gamma-glutamyl-gamma-aminobutyrate hydrolase PuuD